jgi:hypothetical protein
VIQFVRYCDDVMVNEACQAMVLCVAPNPWNAAGDHADKQIDCVLEGLRLAFGDYAGHVRISVH